jgi:hypothetical protein
MWTFGYTEWEITENEENSSDPCLSPIKVVLGEERTFSQAISGLLKYVQNCLNEAEEYELECWQALEADIRDIHDDPGIMDDPDMWEDETFTDIYGTEFYIQEV